MLRYEIHSCTDVTGFSLMGHSYEMAQGSGMSLHIESRKVPFHPEALEMAAMGFIPAGAYRNRDYAGAGVARAGEISRALEDIFYDPQTERRTSDRRCGKGRAGVSGRAAAGDPGCGADRLRHGACAELDHSGMRAVKGRSFLGSSGLDL